MTTNPHPETILTMRASRVLKQTPAMAAFRLLFTGYQPAKGALSRVVDYIGEDVRMPGTRTPLIVVGLNQAHGMLKVAERDPGTNTLGYLVAAATAILTPLFLTCQLRVADAQGHIWNARYSDWSSWREGHPGQLAVTREQTGPTPRVLPELSVLERRLLGDIFASEIEGYANAAHEQAAAAV